MANDASPTALCEFILREHKEYNTSHKIFLQQNIVIEQFLQRRIELVDVYAELCDKLGLQHSILWTFFDLLLAVATFWSPTQARKARADRERLQELNEEIARSGTKLAALLGQRDELHETSDWSSNTHYHPRDVIDEASSQNFLYQNWLRDPLRQLSGRFDLKYWPSLAEIVQVVADDAARAVPEAKNPMTDAATEGLRPSLADFFKAFFAAMNDSRNHSCGFIPDDFSLSDASVASLANCALDLDPDKMVDGAYVKRLRQRERGRHSA